MYYYVERLGFNQNDNLIDYKVGPIEIKLDVYTQKITIKSNILWEKEFNNFILSAQCCWEIKSNDLKYNNETNIEIDITYKILRKYLFYNIIFLDVSCEEKKNQINAYKKRINEIDNNINIDDEI